MLQCVSNSEDLSSLDLKVDNHPELTISDFVKILTNVVNQLVAYNVIFKLKGTADIRIEVLAECFSSLFVYCRQSIQDWRH